MGFETAYSNISSDSLEIINSKECFTEQSLLNNPQLLIILVNCILPEDKGYCYS